MNSHLIGLRFFSAGTAWADLFEPFPASFQLGKNVFSRSRPHERLGLFVVRCDEFHDFFDEVWNALKAAPSHGLVRQLGEPALHQIEPA